MRETITGPAIEPIISEPQKATARVANYLEFLKIIDIGAEYYLAKKKLDPQFNDPSFGKKDIKLILEDLYFASSESNKIDRLKEDWGDEFYRFDDALSSIRPKLQKTGETIFKSANKLNTIDRLKITIKAALAMTNNLSGEQQARIISLMGYTQEELTDTAKKIGVSAGLTASTGIAAWVFVSSAALFGGSHPFVEQYPQKDLIVASSYIGHYLSAVVKSYQNMRMLKDQDIETSPDILATSIFLLSKKLLPDKIRLRDLTTLAAGVFPAVFTEIYSASLLNPDFGPSTVISKNIAGTIFNSAMAGAVKWWINKKR